MSICCIFGCYGSDIGTALHFRGRRLQLADIDGIRIIDAGSDVDDAAGQSFFSGLAHGLAYGNDAVTAVRGEDIPLGHLAAIAQGCGVSHAIRHGSMVVKGHVLAIACSGIHADSDAVIAGLCAIADGNGIILGCRFIADGHRVLSIGQGIDTSSQRICAFGTVIIVVALRRVCRLNAEEMGLRLLQLGHVHGAGSGNPRRIIFLERIALTFFTALVMFDIIALLPFFYICNRVRANSYTAIDSGIGIMTEDDCVFFLCCDRRLFVGIADNHRIFYTFRLAIITKENRILGIGDGIIGTGGIQMGSTCDLDAIPIYHIVIRNFITGSGYLIINTDNLSLLRVVSHVSSANNKRSAAAI